MEYLVWFFYFKTDGRSFKRFSSPVTHNSCIVTTIDTASRGESEAKLLNDSLFGSDLLPLDILHLGRGCVAVKIPGSWTKLSGTRRVWAHGTCRQRAEGGRRKAEGQYRLLPGGQQTPHRRHELPRHGRTSRPYRAAFEGLLQAVEHGPILNKNRIRQSIVINTFKSKGAGSLTVLQRYASPPTSIA